MNVLITGGTGQLGKELGHTLPAGWTLAAPGRNELDIRDRRACENSVRTGKPHLVINTAAWTDVDGAEDEPDAAHEANADGAENIAAAAAAGGARFLHISTDYVFDGHSGLPYRTSDSVNPASAYGRSKAEGERRVETATDGKAVILRTAWLYSAHGRNFVKTMLRVFGERAEARVVADQVGTPSWARGLALAIWRFAERPSLRGIFHWTDAGVASWYDFAVAIQEEALALGILKKAVPIIPVTTAEFPRPAKRPVCAVLDKSRSWGALGMIAPHWRESLRQMLAEENARA